MRTYLLEHLSTILALIPGIVALVPLGIALAHFSLPRQGWQHVFGMLLR